MKIEDDFVFRPLPAVARTIHFPFPPILNPLGPLASLAGTWGGTGFNVIWRPDHTPGQDRFLELNLTNESLQFDAISGPIPNRGLVQPDINMFGLTYLQQISDANLNAGLHVEPGIWAVVPKTSDPKEGPTVVRMGSIPHGTTILAQGTAASKSGAPTIPAADIRPFPVGSPANRFQFPEQTLTNPTNFRSPPAQIVGITQAMVNDPNSVLRSAIHGQQILHTTTLQISTDAALTLDGQSTTNTPVGGGTANTAFLAGAADGPNAASARVDATFWIETVTGTPNFLQLQYTQLVLLNFNGLSWPHITVGTLKKNVPVQVPVWKIDPDIPRVQLRKAEPQIPLDAGAHIRDLSLSAVKPTPKAKRKANRTKRAKRK